MGGAPGWIFWRGTSRGCAGVGPVLGFPSVTQQGIPSGLSAEWFLWMGSCGCCPLKGSYGGVS